MKKKVILFSDTPLLKSGMGIVINELANQFYKDYEVYLLGWWQGQFNPVEAQKAYPLPIYPIDKESLHREGYRKEPIQVESALKSILRDSQEEAYLITLGDVYDFRYMPVIKDKLSTQKNNLRWLFYLNVDSEIISNRFMTSFMWTNKIICTSRFGMNKIKQFDPTLNVDYIYHGVDCNEYKSLNLTNNQKCIKHPQTGDTIFMGDKFVVLIDAQNTSRKNISAGIEIFDQFAKDKKDTYLIVITDPLSTDLDGVNIFEIMLEKEWDPEKIMLIANNISKGRSLSYEHMNYFYNLSTVLLNASRGEGFGLPYLQAFATNVIPVATESTSAPELLGEGRGEMIKVAVSEQMCFASVAAHIDIEDGVKTLNKLYDKWADGITELMPYFRAGMAFANQNSWEHCGNRFKEIIEKRQFRQVHSFFPSSYNIPINTEMRRFIAKQVIKQKEKYKIGMVVMGGIGDNLQATPIIKGITRKFKGKDFKLYIICEAFPELFFKANDLITGFIHPNIVTINAFQKSFIEIVKSTQDLFDVFYDIRYISYPFVNNSEFPVSPDELNYFRQYSGIYHAWPWQNNRAHMTGDHVVNMRLKSAGLAKYASITDMAMDISPIELPEDKYVVVNNGAGGVGKLKIIPHAILQKVVDYVRSRGLKVIQLGQYKEKYIAGCIDLRGITNLWESSYVLKHAAFTISPEGSVFHMAKAQGTRSIIWCSVTHPECFAYDDTIVLPSKNTKEYKCNPCWWTGGDYWHSQCMRGFEFCENFPSAEEIIEKVKELL